MKNNAGLRPPEKKDDFPEPTLRDGQSFTKPSAGRLSRRPSAMALWAIAAVALTLSALSVEFSNIAGTLPYPQHVDEPALASAGSRIVTTGSLRPESYNYPSLPKYLAAAGLAAGVVRAASNLEIVGVDQIGNVGYPHYDNRMPMQTARQLFALLSALALALTGMGAWFAFRRPASIFLAPLITLVSPLYLYHSWAYLNVDVVGTCFVTMALASCLAATWRPSLFRLAAVPAFCAGLAAGSKYTLALVMVPVLLGVWFYGRPGQRLAGTIVAALAFVAAFVLVAPYSVLDLPNFVNGLAYEAFHYATHQPGFEDRPGLLQLWFYVAHFVSDFGVAALGFAVLGVLAGVGTDWRRVVILVAFPLVSLALLIQERVHVARNVLALHPIVSIFVAFGAVWTHATLVAALRRSRFSLAKRPWGEWLAAVGVLILAVPVSNIVNFVGDRTDSRVVAKTWLASRISSGWTVVVPRQLAFSVPDLESAGLAVRVVDLQSARKGEETLDMLADVPAPSVILVPRWGADPNYPGGKEAAALNAVTSRWQPIRAFGSEMLQVNHENHAPNGNPAFFVAALNLPRAGIDWLESFDKVQNRKRRRQE